MTNTKYIIGFIFITIFIFSAISIVNAENPNNISHNTVDLSNQSVSILENHVMNNSINATKNTETIKNTETTTNTTKINDNSELKLSEKELENLGLNCKIKIKFDKDEYCGKSYKIVDLSTNKTYKVANINIEDDNSLERTLNLFKKDKYYNANQYDLIRINLKNNQIYKLQHLVMYNQLSNLEINGNGATIEYVSSYTMYEWTTKKVSEYNFIINNQKLYINNLKLKNFDECITNKGYLKLNNVVFESNNRAIDNYGKISCISCLFKNNTKTDSASIYNRKKSYAECLNCSFKNKNSKINEIYCEELSFTKIINTDGSLINKLKYKCNKNGIIVFRNSTIPIVHIQNVTTNNTINSINEYSKYDVVILNFKNQTYRFKDFSFKGLVENIIINGNGATFKGYHTKKLNTPLIVNIYSLQYKVDDSDENYNNIVDTKHFAIINPNHNLIIYNATLKYYNQAIINNGNFKAEHVIFDSNKIKQSIINDYGGAIYNKEGELECINCTFINNSGKYAGAIYNTEEAFARIIDCEFYNNSFYNDKNIDIYNMDSESLEFIITTNMTNDTDNSTTCIIKNYKGFSKIHYLTISIGIGIGMSFLIPGVSEAFIPFLGESMAEIFGTAIVSSFSTVVVSSIHGYMHHDININNILTSSIIGGCLSIIDLKLSSAVIGEIGYEAVITKFGTDSSIDDGWDVIEICMNGLIDLLIG